MFAAVWEKYGESLFVTGVIIAIIFNVQIILVLFIIVITLKMK